MRFWRALDLGADGVVGVLGDDAAPPVCKDAEPVRSWKYEVVIGEVQGEVRRLKAIGQFAV
jgi:hypothetical protein